MGNIIEQNKLIAEFMGGLYTPSFELRKGEIWLPIQGICRYDTIEIGRGRTLKYHTSWDWIMPVIEEIEKHIYANDEYYNFQILGGCYVIIISSHGNELVTSDNGQSKLECVYNACIEFIRWHNNQKA